MNSLKTVKPEALNILNIQKNFIKIKLGTNNFRKHSQGRRLLNTLIRLAKFVGIYLDLSESLMTVQWKAIIAGGVSKR